jgi:UDP-2,3-diacylglucosamine pyrophosphatase LpxH
MSGDERVTLIVSDLHVGGGPADKGDDHIYQNDQLVRFIREQAASPEGRAGRIELIFNGDFLEFAQTNHAAFTHPSDDFWCSELESLEKLETIVAGHRDVFAELVIFQEGGNAVTVAAGNHDVDLYWPRIQSRLREVVGGDVRFELGKEWIDRYDAKLQIGHGHMQDPANKFEHWDNPILVGAWGAERLEMCPGTLFMVKFVNKLEAQYPFADNLLPVTKLASVLLRDDKAGLAAVGWMFSTFAMTTSASVLHAGSSEDYGNRLLERIGSDTGLARRLDAVLGENGLEAARNDLRAGRLAKPALSKLMFDLLGRIHDAQWHALFDLPPGHTLGSDDVTLSALMQANFDDGKQKLRAVAQERVDATGASVVVMGHTHQPDVKILDGGTYYNPGCWTRYLELGAGQKVTLEDLRDESRYPYQLNFVRVERDGENALRSKMHCFERG